MWSCHHSCRGVHQLSLQSAGYLTLMNPEPELIITLFEWRQTTISSSVFAGVFTSYLCAEGMRGQDDWQLSEHCYHHKRSCHNLIDVFDGLTKIWSAILAFLEHQMKEKSNKAKRWAETRNENHKLLISEQHVSFLLFFHQLLCWVFCVISVRLHQFDLLTFLTSGNNSVVMISLNPFVHSVFIQKWGTTQQWFNKI